MRLLTGLLVLALVSCQSTVEEPPAEISDKDTHYFADDVNEIVESETIEPDTIALFNNWIKNTPDYLIKQMMEMGMTKSSAEFLHRLLWTISDGFIKRVSLPSLSESDLKKFTNSLQYNS